MRWKQLSAILGAAALAAACQSPAAPGIDGPIGASAGTAGIQSVPPGTNGGGQYLLQNVIDAAFDFNAVATGSDGAEGHFFQSFIFGGFLVEFRGRVTCFSVDPANRRAWIGGVVTENNSTHPQFTTARTQPGRDVWFRVLDGGEGAAAPPDRTTIFGFEGDRDVITSAEYCAARLWLDNNANTHAVTRGNIQVRP